MSCNTDLLNKKQSVDFIENLTQKICATYTDEKAINHNMGSNVPRESEILTILNQILELVFPGFAEKTVYQQESLKYLVGETLATTYVKLTDILLRAYRCVCKGGNDCVCEQLADEAARYLLESIPDIRETMKEDIQAAYDGDPAARSLEEIVLSYPGVRAITIQRIAHCLYVKNVPMIPRMIGEYAHRITGIDIHPGAVLGKGIFIDHGTGVVIGETAEIGSGVKIYQGVTLGALSFPKDSSGVIIKGKKRHPTIKDNVTIYAGATVLGAVTIGEDSVIGGNVWITKSTPPGTKITIAPPELSIKTKEI